MQQLVNLSDIVLVSYVTQLNSLRWDFEINGIRFCIDLQLTDFHSATQEFWRPRKISQNQPDVWAWQTLRNISPRWYKSCRIIHMLMVCLHIKTIRRLSFLVSRGYLEEALSLAEKYRDFHLLIEICEELDDQEKLQNYMNKFRNEVWCSLELFLINILRWKFHTFYIFRH